MSVLGTYRFFEAVDVKLTRTSLKYNLVRREGVYTGQAISYVGLGISLQFANLGDSSVYYFDEVCSQGNRVSRAETTVPPGGSISITGNITAGGVLAATALKVSDNQFDTHPNAPCFAQPPSVIVKPEYAAILGAKMGIPVQNVTLTDSHTQASYWKIQAGN
jgi:hypothetical protein